MSTEVRERVRVLTHTILSADFLKYIHHYFSMSIHCCSGFVVIKSNSCGIGLRDRIFGLNGGVS